MAPAKIRTIILDLGDVFLKWSPINSASVSPKLLKEFMLSPIWYQYNCGLIGESECYTKLAQHFSLEASQIAEAFSQARATLVEEEALVAALRSIRATYEGCLCIYAMSNISYPDWDFVRKKPFDWAVFDRVFTSCEAAMCKPELRFYNHVLEATKTIPEETVFIDDNEENVLAARSLGIHSIRFDNTNSVCRMLWNILGDPMLRGEDFLLRNARKMYSVRGSGQIFRDNFSQLLVLEATGNMYE